MLETLSTILGLFYSTLIVQLPVPTHSFAGQTIIVTGSNTGLGLEAARHIAALNSARLILAVRNLEKGEAAKTSIEKSTGRTGVIEVWQLDLSSYESVLKFAERANRDLKRLDCLLSNAAIGEMRYFMAEDNESSVTVNVVSTFLLPILLLPLVRKTATECNVQPRLSFVASDVHFFTSFPERESPNIFERVNSEKAGSSMMRRYTTTKMMEVLLAREFAEKIKPASGALPVVVNYVNPSLCMSDLGRNGPGWMQPIDWAMRKLVGRTTEAGSRTLVHGAASGEESHGCYLSDCQVRDPAPFVRSEEGKKTQIRLWDELMEKLQKISPGIRDIL